MTSGGRDTLDLWTFSDAHVGTDARFGRSSLAEAIRHSEQGSPAGPAFDWDVALDLGDMSGGQDPPDDAEGSQVVRQFADGLRDHAHTRLVVESRLRHHSTMSTGPTLAAR